jgi:hypothetical protein
MLGTTAPDLSARRKAECGAGRWCGWVGCAGRRRPGHMADPRGGYHERLVRLATFLLRDDAAAEQVVRDVLESSPPQARDAEAERRAVVSRCRAIIPG